MKRKILIVLIISAGLIISCATQPPQEIQEIEEDEPVKAETEKVEEQVTDVKEEAEKFVVTEEIYNKTFDEIEFFIETLNQIIREKDYKTWLTYLTDEYIDKIDNIEYLQKQSEKPLLKKKKVVLKTLEDYFIHVVVPSRSKAKVDDIEFIDIDHIKAISIIRNNRGVLYLLVRINGRWKIGVW